MALLHEVSDFHQPMTMRCSYVEQDFSIHLCLVFSKLYLMWDLSCMHLLLVCYGVDEGFPVLLGVFPICQ